MKNKRTPKPELDLETLVPLLIGIWRRFHKLSGPPDQLQTREFRGVVEEVKKLVEAFEGTGNLLETDYFSDRKMLGAYLLYSWIIHYQQAISLLGELPRPPIRVLDVCSGPAPFGFAALKYGAREVCAIDRNEEALSLGAELAGRYGYPLTVRRWVGPRATLPVEGEFDCILVGHCLQELFPETRSGWKEAQEQFIHQLLRRLTPDGFLIIVDNSRLAANRRVLQLRDQVVMQGVPVQAPCVWKGACPSLQTPNSPCYAQRELEKPWLVKEIQRAASINLGSLKMTYLILRSPKAAWPQLPDKKLYRIVSPPVESHLGNRYYLCGTQGKKSLDSHLTTHPVESRAFEHLRRGDLIEIDNELDRPHGFTLVKGTTLRIEAACGKPLKEDVPHVEQTD